MKKKNIVPLTAGLAFLMAGPVWPAVVSFSLVPSLSSITHTAVAGAGVMATEQGPGSMVTNYAGTIMVELDDLIVPTTIEIVDTSINGIVNGQWLPDIGGGDTGQPGSPQDADSAWKYLVGDFFLANRNTEIALISSFSTPVGGNGGEYTFPNEFDVSYSNGSTDWNVQGSFGTDALSDVTIFVGIIEESSLSISEGVATLTIPISRFYTQILGGNIGTTVELEGNLVATAIVPVPAAAWLFGSALGLLGWAKRTTDRVELRGGMTRPSARFFTIW